MIDWSRDCVSIRKSRTWLRVTIPSPSSWSSQYRALQLNTGLSFMARDGGDVYINQNAIYDSGNAWKYVPAGSCEKTASPSSPTGYGQLAAFKEKK